MPRATVPVKSDVLIWARESAGFSQEDAARLLEVPLGQVQAWESGTESPTVGQLGNLAKVYKRPRSALLLPAAPPLPPAPKDFRTVLGQGASLSLATLVAVRDARRMRDIADELLEADPDLVPQTRLPWVDGIQGNPEEAGAMARASIGVSVADQLSWSNANHAFNAWRHKLQILGILTFSKPMPRDDCRGFSLYEDGATPVIVVNRYENDQAKTFTLIHEYGHILRREGGICVQSDSVNIERWCNRFAASFLVPKHTLTTLLEGSQVISLDTVGGLSRSLKVSRHVVVLRLVELGFANSGLYRAIHKSDIEQEDWEKDSDPDEQVRDVRIPIERTRSIRQGKLLGSYAGAQEPPRLRVAARARRRSGRGGIWPAWRKRSWR